ncbi:MAG: ThiF family adenylyltransferase [Steroidobacteraceae bacterium]
MATNTFRRVTGCRVDMPALLKSRLFAHLFPGDNDEHAAVLAASVAYDGNRVRLLVRHYMPAEDGVDYVASTRGYRHLRGEFVHRCIVFCREQKLVYLAVHNHGGSDRVDFSGVDLSSHERGYPALLDLTAGIPVGALVFAARAAAGDIWWTATYRTRIEEVRVIGHTIERLSPEPRRTIAPAPKNLYDRQILLFGAAGQERLADATVGVIGAGGAGSLIIEYLARLGIGRVVVADPDRLEPSNLSRVVGARARDARQQNTKVSIAQRVARAANPRMEFISIPDTVFRESVAKQFLHCDFLFLAADTATARLVFNAIVQQYFVPGVQVGAKVHALQNTGQLLDVFSVMRWVLPGLGCLWCSGLISPHRLAWEAKADIERETQRYGTEVADPSVITLNAVASSHAVNEFLMAILGLRTAPDTSIAGYMWHHLSQRTAINGFNAAADCTECSDMAGSRFGRGDAVSLPTAC